MCASRRAPPCWQRRPACSSTGSPPRSAVTRWSTWRARRSCCSARRTTTRRRCTRWMRGGRRRSLRRSRCSTPRSRSTPTGAGCDRRCHRWRSGCATPSRRSPASRLRQPPTPATSRTGCSLTGYAGDAAATARALRCRAVDALTDAGETLAAAQILAAVEPPDLARRGRLREVQGRLDEAAETFEAADMPAGTPRTPRSAPGPGRPTRP